MKVGGIMEKDSCRFCGLANKLIPCNIVFEDENISCFLDIDPINKGHVLIVPKRHYVELVDVDGDTCNSISVASKIIYEAINEIYKPDGISIMQNGGIFNDVGHYHIHVFPRYKGDGFGWTYPKDDAVLDNYLTDTKERFTNCISEIRPSR